MGTNTAKLKKGSKGTPPPVETAQDVIKTNARPEKAAEKTVALQLKIPETKLNEFSQLAIENHGFKKGAKSNFFLDLLESYKENN